MRGDAIGTLRSKTGVWRVSVIATSESPVSGSWRVAGAVTVTLPKTLTYKQALKELLRRVQTEP